MLMSLCVQLLVLHAFVHSISWWGNWLKLKLSWQRPLTVWWRKSQMNKQTERQTLLQHTPHYALLHMCWVIKTINPWQFKCNTNKKTELIFIFLKCCISSTSIMCIVIDINYMAYCVKTFCICSPQNTQQLFTVLYPAGYHKQTQTCTKTNTIRQENRILKILISISLHKFSHINNYLLNFHLLSLTLALKSFCISQNKMTNTVDTKRASVLREFKESSHVVFYWLLV